MRYRYLVTILPLVLSACSFQSERGTLAELRDVKLELVDEKVDDGLDKAMESYRKFLAETPESAMTPEAIRRIADLSIEKEYGYVADSGGQAAAPSAVAGKPIALAQPKTSAPVQPGAAGAAGDVLASGKIATVGSESDKAFEKRMAQGETVQKGTEKGFAAPVPEGEGDLENANAQQAIELYKKLLAKYPMYERNDQVYYQMSRAYEELGKTDQAMEVMNEFIQKYPTSKYMDEVQFRRAEYYFTRKKHLDAEDAYQSIVNMGASSSYYELALYKLGWTFYKQDMYEEALNKYFALFDYKLSIGYDFAQTEDQAESKRIEDTYRVISLSFSNMGGPEAVTDYFARNGHRNYEDQVYSHLGEFYFNKRRYSDAAAAYKAFVGLYPFHEVSPHFNMRVIDIYMKGGFAKLVVEAKKEFAQTYALNSEYWHYFDVNARPDVIGFLKSNLKDLANHYHALYQDKRFVKDKDANYNEALLWYRNYLSSFPREVESPAINYQMADLMLENKSFGDAAVAYENTSYNYPLHEKSSAAGYAAVYAYREHLKVVAQAQRAEVKQKIIQSSLKFADTYPDHEKVTIVLGAAADDLYEMKNYELAVATARKLITNYPNTEKSLLRSAWIVVGHGSYDLKLYPDAENAYLNVLALTAEDDASRAKFYDNLAASIYKQGEQANVLQDYKAAAEHFLRVGKLAPQSTIYPNAEYDASAALIKLEDWDRAAEVLVAFRKNFPNHELQPEVTKKVAFVYRSAGKLELAAAEYERIEQESKDEEVRRGSLIIAAELYQEINAKQRELAVYKRYVGYFPKPVESALEIYSKMATVYLQLGEKGNHMATLEKIVAADSSAGEERTDRTRFLAAQAALVITEPLYDKFVSIKLVNPIKDNLLKKKNAMKTAVNGYTKLLDYEVADVTAAATYYMAEIYYHFSRALSESERPTNLSELEMEQYELAIEEQVYPFEEKAIDVHKKNLELLYSGIYSSWIDKSIGKLAKIFPAVYARTEESTGIVTAIDGYQYLVQVIEPVPAEQPAAEAAKSGAEATDATTPAQADNTSGATGANQGTPAPESGAGTEAATNEVTGTEDATPPADDGAGEPAVESPVGESAAENPNVVVPTPAEADVNAPAATSGAVAGDEATAPEPAAAETETPSAEGAAETTSESPAAAVEPVTEESAPAVTNEAPVAAEDTAQEPVAAETENPGAEGVTETSSEAAATAAEPAVEENTPAESNEAPAGGEDATKAPVTEETENQGGEKATDNGDTPAEPAASTAPEMSPPTPANETSGDGEATVNEPGVAQ